MTMGTNTGKTPLLPYAEQLQELRVDGVMPEWVARARGIEPGRHPRAVVELRPTVRSRRRVPVRLVAFSDQFFTGRVSSHDPRSRWADKASARESFLREAATLAVFRYLLEQGASPDVARVYSWNYLGARWKRLFGDRYALRRHEARIRDVRRGYGSSWANPDAEGVLRMALDFPDPFAIELDAGKVEPAEALRRVEMWTRVYAGVLWVSLIRSHAERVAAELVRVKGTAYVYALSRWWDESAELVRV